MTAITSFHHLLAQFRAAAPIATDDVVGAMRPLLNELRALHAAGEVAALDRVDRLGVTANGQLTLGAVERHVPVRADEAIASIEQRHSDALEVTRRIGVVDAGGRARAMDRMIGEPGATPDAPMFWPLWGSWERAAGHHDALTDIYHLGLIFGALATGLDLGQRDDLATFVAQRTNLVRLNPRLHPVVARVIADMTDIRRSKRAADLDALVDVLDDYRAVEVDDADARRRDLAGETNPTVRRARTLEYFRNRLFEVTRRNKLLYYADRHGIDLTRGSLPNVLNIKTLRADQLLTATPAMIGRLAKLHDGAQATGDFDLRRYLQFNDYPFLGPQLDKIRAAARKDLRELGFNQLRLVIAMLRWFEPEQVERIDTPLLMLPVTLKRLSGSTDGYSLALDAPVTECEVNPVLRFVFAERFKIELPASIDLTAPAALDGLRARIEDRVRAVHPGTALRLVDKPRIALIQKTVKRQLDDWRARQKRAGQELKDWKGVAYSYSEGQMQPLGYELFERFVRARPAPGRDVAQGRDANAQDRSASVEMFSLDTGTDNRLEWEIDLTAVTLANFNTRKMSLVRDYELLLDGSGGSHANYTRLFEHGARPQLARLKAVPHTERNLVLPSDPSQDEAVLRARTGESYVIQGPPGTGKSQTIANLLADLAAAGKSVLFVCAKRVALDVVHRRLKDAGLGDIACLVHDARDDRQTFIADLKSLYAEWSASRPSRTLDDKRATLVAEIESGLRPLEAFAKAMTAPAGGGAFRVRGLIDQAIAERLTKPKLSNREREQMPPWQDFLAGEAALGHIERTVSATGHKSRDIAELLRVLKAEVAVQREPVTFLERTGAAAESHLDDIAPALAAAVPPRGAKAVTLETACRQAVLARRLRVLAEAGKLNLVDEADPEATRVRRQLAQLADLDAVLARTEQATLGWTKKLSPAETEAALKIAREKEGRFWSFLSSDWRQVKQLVAIAHKGTVTQHAAVLEQLLAEHAARAARDSHAQTIRTALAVDELDDVRTALAAIGPEGAAADPHERALLEACRSKPRELARSVLRLAADADRLQRARDDIGRVFEGFDDLTADNLRVLLSTLADARDQAVDLARRMQALEAVSPSLAGAWRKLAMSREQFRAASLHTSIERTLRAHPDAEAIDAATLETTGQALGRKLADLRELNARRTLDRQKARFRKHMSAGDKAYDEGRKFLEHQFGLTRPSAAMRDFLTGPRARVVGDLKPIWMMSPLSVADTLPLDEALFDVVVFDEASQIPIEDGVPTLYRARQAIVVGDAMQLPPASYFSKRSEDDGDVELPDYIAFGMQTESLLDRAAVALPGTRLDWHYRSRHEALIGFCNQAFYDGGLKTIPSRQNIIAAEALEPTATVTQKALAERLLTRPLTFHKVEDGRFVGQRNLAEANAIAEMVKALLATDTDRSIGIVAFSQPQQAAIEEALEKLAAGNAAFRSRYDAALAREDEELFVKNLENVQGDERDVMIVSVAYAPNAEGRMLMNFGPINQEGGEKRLNVIFSRAKHHVVLVTSIDPARITNDYNPGARALKRYMMYAAAASAGDPVGMRTALAGYPGATAVDQSAAFADPLADRIAERETGAGQEVVRNFGQSTARCDIAVKPAGATAFKTAILTDNMHHHAGTDVVERYVTYPDLLRASGWQVRFALGQDWVRRG